MVKVLLISFELINCEEKRLICCPGIVKAASAVQEFLSAYLTERGLFTRSNKEFKRGKFILSNLNWENIICTIYIEFYVKICTTCQNYISVLEFSFVTAIGPSEMVTNTEIQVHAVLDMHKSE